MNPPVCGPVLENSHNLPTSAFFVCLIACLFGIPAHGTDPAPLGKLTNGFLDSNDRAGYRLLSGTRTDNPIAISGNTAVIGAHDEDSNATGINGDAANNDAQASGAAYVYLRDGDTNWVLQAYLKASNTEAYDRFGACVAIDGDVIVVGAPFEDSDAAGVNGDQSNNDGINSGAAYIFVREGTNWVQEAYLKLDPFSGTRGFGQAVAIYGDTVAIGSDGAMDVYVKDGHTWRLEQRVAPDLTQPVAASDRFGESVSLSGNRLVVGAPGERSSATGVNGDESDNFAGSSGAAYVYGRTNGVWTKDAFLKPSNTEANLFFGQSVAISGDTVLIGAYGEDSSATGINGDDADQGASDSGAAYVFHHDGANWSQQAYLKASDTAASDFFGVAVALSGDLAAIGADLADDTHNNSGAVYLFQRSGGSWSQTARLNAFDGKANWSFGGAVAIDEPIVIGSSYFADFARGATYAYLLDASNFVSEISVTGNGNEIVNGSTTLSSTLNTDFGSSGIATNEFVITNSGTGTLTLQLPRFSGDAASDFSLVVPPPPTVAPGGATSFKIRFAPTAGGARAAVVSIPNNDADESIYSIAIQGTGTGAPEIMVVGNGLEIVAGDASPAVADATDFGVTDFFTGIVTNSFTVTNTGTATLTLEVPTITGSTDFRLITTPAALIDPGASTEFSVAFDPSSYLTNTAVVSLGNADADENPYEFTIQGVSTPEPELDILANGFPILTGDTTAEVSDGTDFGTVTVGSSTITNFFTMTNSGTATLTFAVPTITGAAGFQIVAPSSLSLAPGETTTFAITFAPTANGPRPATVSIASNDRDEPDFTFNITAIATPVSEADPIYFGELKDGALDTNDRAGDSVAISGHTAVVGVVNERSNATGVNGDPSDNTEIAAGAAHVYVLGEGTNWVLQAYLKASNTEAYDNFGAAVAVHGDIIAVGAPAEDSNATGVNGDETNDDSLASGAVYVFSRQGTNWSQVAYLKPDSGSGNDRFGQHVGVYGETIVIGTDGAEAAYVFVRSGNTWIRQARLAPDLVGSSDGFGRGVAISGETVVVGAYSEDSNATGVNGDAGNDSSGQSGAAYVFVRGGETWTQQAYLKPSNTDAGDFFGEAVSISGDTIVVGADREGSAASGVNGNQADNSLIFAGAAYVFTRTGSEWSQQAYLKASNPSSSDGFGESVAVAGDIILVGAKAEDSNATSINGDQTSSFGSGRGAAYLFVRSGSNWTQKAYLKGYFGSPVEQFGDSVAADGSLLLASAPYANGSRGITYPILLAASNTVPEMAILGNGSEIANGSTTISSTLDTDFGAAATNTFTITNSGTGTLTIGYPRISGAEADDFRLLEAPAASLAPNTATTFSIGFAATASAVRRARVSIANNDADEMNYVFDIQGTGAVGGEPEIVVTGNAMNITAGSATPLPGDGTDFGSADLLSTTITNTFFITNTGTVILTLTPPQISGPAAGDFSIHLPPATTLAPGGDTALSIVFDPDDLGIRSANVSISNNDTDENPFTFAIQGTGTGTAIIGVLGGGLEITNNATPPSTANGTEFGPLDVLATGISKTFVITNRGSIPLSLGTASIAGPAAGDFTIPTQPGSPITPGGFTTLTVVFDPSAPGLREAGVSLPNNSADDPFTFAIAGTGSGKPEIAVYGNGLLIASGTTVVAVPPGTEFGLVDIGGAPASHTFSITNLGSLPLTISAPIFSGPAAADFSAVPPGTGPLSPGQGTTLGITFDPSVPGLRSAIASIANNDEDESPYTFAVRGGGRGEPEITVGGKGVSIADGETVPSLTTGTDFGVHALVGKSITNTFAITNIGTTNLLIGLPVISGSAAGDFALLSPPTSPLAPGLATSFEVVFDPSALGERPAMITFTNSDADESPFDFAIRGSGVGFPEISVLGKGVNITNHDVLPTLDDGTHFGTINTDSATFTNTFVIRNDGTTNLTLSPPVITGAAAADFTLAGSPATDLAPGISTSLSIVFDPSVDGTRAATISISNNDDNEASFEFAIAGTGTTPPPATPEIAILGKMLLIPAGANSPRTADGTDFGSVDTASGAATNTFVVTNIGTAELTLSVPTVTGGAAAEFALGAPPSLTVPVSGKTAFSLVFDPAFDGARPAVVTLINNDPDESPYSFAITGTGTTPTDPEIGISGNGLAIADGDASPQRADGTDFGSQDVASGSVTTSFVITNSGTGALTLSPPALSGPAAADYSIDTAPGPNVAPGTGTTFSITFNPSAEGTRSATFTLANNDADENPYTFALVGNGTNAPASKPEIAILGNGIEIAHGDTTAALADGTDFGALDVAGASVTNRFVITNSGTLSLNLGVVTVSGTHASDYTIVEQPAAILSPGSGTVMTVRFDPSGAGVRSATIQVSNDDADEGPYEFAVHGQGSAPPPNASLLTAYLKATNTTAGDRLGQAVAMSGDTLVIGAPSRSVGGHENQGMAYVFVRDGSNWLQQAELVAPAGGSNDLFGNAVDISDSTIVIGAPGEDSAAAGVDSNQQDSSAPNAGAAYVFVRDIDTWSPQSYLKPDNTDAGDRFGESVAIDGSSVIVGAHREDGPSSSVNQNAGSNTSTNAGAAYVFSRNGTTWAQEAYLKAPNTDQGDWFGFDVDVSGDLFAISAPQERGLSGTDGDQSDNSGFAVGAVYLIERNPGAPSGWLLRGYLKAGNAFPLDQFGWSLSLHGDTVAVGTPFEDSAASGLNGDGDDNSMNSSGAVYIFGQRGVTWSQQVYVKASNPDQGDRFGNAVDLSGDRLMVGAPFEQSNTVGLDGNQTDNSLSSAGAAYLFTRSGGSWSQTRYFKATNTDGNDFYGSSVAVSDNAIAIGAPTEDGNATTINGDPDNNLADSSGAAYIYFTPTRPIGLQAYLKASNPSTLARFSDAVAIGDEFAAVGAPEVDTVYLFRKLNHAWQPLGTLNPAAGGAKRFGHALAISGTTLVVGAPYDRSVQAGINADENDTSGTQVGSAYVYFFDGNDWIRQTYVKASNADSSDCFGDAVAIDGDTLVIGAPREDSDSPANEASNAAANTGAAYVFVRNGTTWTQQTYLKASTIDSGGGDQFGSSVAIHGDTIVVGAPEEDSSSANVNGDQTDNSMPNAGAAYVFFRTGAIWLQQAYIKSPSPVVAGEMGRTSALHGDTLALGVPINNHVNLFTRAGSLWTHSATLSSANAQTGDRFGAAIALHDSRLVVGAPNEQSRSRVLNRLPDDNEANDSGAVYEFVRSGTNWVQRNYLKAHNTDPADRFGTRVAISSEHIIAGAPLEDGSGTGVSGNPASRGSSGAGAAYIYGTGNTRTALPNDALVIRATAPHSASHNLILPAVAGAAYQWYFSPYPTGNAVPIAGATGSTYTTGLAERNRTGYYSALVDTAAGSFLTTPTFLDIVKPQEILSITRLGNGHVRLRFDDVNSPGRPLNLSRVEVQWRASLPHGSDTNWNRVDAFTISATSETVTFDDTSSPRVPIRFYRVLEH